MVICAECGWEFEYDRHADDQCHDTETGEYLCPDCTRIYNRLASEMMEKSFNAMPELYKQALSVTRLTGIGDLCDVMEEYRE